MPSIKIPKALSSKEILAGQVRELNLVGKRLKARAAAFDEITTMAHENADLEARIDQAKESMFMLLYERIELAEAAHVDEYVRVVQAELERLEEQGEKAKP